MLKCGDDIIIPAFQEGVYAAKVQRKKHRLLGAS